MTQTIQLVVNRLAPKYANIPGFDIDDIRQEAFIMGMEALERYDESRPLENFLSVHISNRLKNLRRDEFVRTDFKCPKCENQDPDCVRCKKFRANQLSKLNLIMSLDIDGIHDENMLQEDSAYEVVNELRGFISDRIDLSLRRDYLKMLDGERIEPNRRKQIKAQVLEIVEEFYDSK